MNLGNVLASIGSSHMLVSANEGGPEDSDVVTTVKSIGVNAADTHLAGS